MGGSLDAYVVQPDTQPRSAIVVLHEIFGVNADMRATCEELATAGYAAVCPDLFWRQERGVDLAVDNDADGKRGVSLYTAYDVDTGVRDVEATIAAARMLGGAARVGVLGFCLGGLLTFLTAARTRVDAAVAFHGGRTEDFLGEAPDVDMPLQMHLAEDDEFITKTAQRQIIAALADNPQVEIHIYAGCHHAFSRHGGRHFDAAAAALSRARTLGFFERHL